jgi:hypothetical protein
VDELRIADVAVAVGEGEPSGLEVAVERQRAIGRRHFKAFEDVERLADRRAAARRRPHPVNVEAAVGDMRGRTPQRLVVGEVARRHHARPDREARIRVWRDRRMIDRLHKRGADRATVENPGSAAGDQLVGVGEVRVADDRPDRGRLALRRQVEAAARGEDPQARHVLLGLVVVGLVDDEALTREHDPGL